VNFRVDPDVVQRLLPAGLAPKLQGDYAIAGICLIRLERIRPVHVPWRLGFSGENAAHRVAVVWRGSDGADREGVYIPMRHTNSKLILMLGGRLFPGLHQPATFDVADTGDSIDISIRSASGDMQVTLQGRAAEQLPSGSAFPSLKAASEFFRGGSVGYSPGPRPRSLGGSDACFTDLACGSAFDFRGALFMAVRPGSVPVGLKRVRLRSGHARHCPSVGRGARLVHRTPRSAKPTRLRHERTRFNAFSLASSRRSLVALRATR